MGKRPRGRRTKKGSGSQVMAKKRLIKDAKKRTALQLKRKKLLQGVRNELTPNALKILENVGFGKSIILPFKGQLVTFTKVKDAAPKVSIKPAPPGFRKKYELLLAEAKSRIWNAELDGDRTGRTLVEDPGTKLKFEFTQIPGSGDPVITKIEKV